MGVSLDAPQANQAWAEEEGFTFDLWTDDERALGRAYGALDSATDRSVARLTVLLDSEGNLLLTYPVVAVGTHPGQVLSDCAAILGG